MPIYQRETLRTPTLVGKYCCLPSVFLGEIVGVPAFILKGTNSRVTFRKLLRGEWLPAEERWTWKTNFDGATPDELADLEGFCRSGGILYVCDTAEEAISLYEDAKQTAKRIAEFQKTAFAEFKARAAAGQPQGLVESLSP